jgi:hypothetical protein
MFVSSSTTHTRSLQKPLMGHELSLIFCHSPHRLSSQFVKATGNREQATGNSGATPVGFPDPGNAHQERQQGTETVYDGGSNPHQHIPPISGGLKPTDGEKERNRPQTKFSHSAIPSLLPIARSAVPSPEGS